MEQGFQTNFFALRSKTLATNISQARLTTYLPLFWHSPGLTSESGFDS